MSCEKADALSLSQGLSSLDIEHLNVCDACTEAVIRASLTTEAIDAFALRRLPGASLLLWKQQLQERWSANQKAESIRQSSSIALCLVSLLTVAALFLLVFLPVTHGAIYRSSGLGPLLFEVPIAASAVPFVCAAAVAAREALAFHNPEKVKHRATNGL